MGKRNVKTTTTTPATPEAVRIAELKSSANNATARTRKIRAEQDKIRKGLANNRTKVAAHVATGKTLADEIGTARVAARLDSQTVTAQSKTLRDIEDKVKRAHGAVDVAAGRVSVAEQRAAIARKTTQRTRAQVAANVVRERMADQRTDLARAAHAATVNRAQVADAMAEIAALRARLG